MWHVVVNFKDCTLTFNAGFHTKTIDDQISLNRKLTFRHLKDVFRVAFIIVLKFDTESSCGYSVGATGALALP